MLNQGTLDGHEVVPASWVDESTRAEARRLLGGCTT